MRTLRVIGFLCVIAAVGVIYVLLEAYHSPKDWFIARLLQLSGTGNSILVPCAIFLSATIAGAAASFSIAQTLSAARCKNTLDFLNLKFTTPTTKDGMSTIRNIAEKYKEEHPNAREDVGLLHAFANEDQHQDFNLHNVRQTLNYFEHLALGVKKRIYDEQLVFEDMAYTIFRLWRRSAAHLMLRNIESHTEMLQAYPVTAAGLGSSPSFSALIWLVTRWRTPWYCLWLPRCPASRRRKLKKLQKEKEEFNLLITEQPKSEQDGARKRRGRQRK
jgi:Domain of unknown function (DUF4760)